MTGDEGPLCHAKEPEFLFCGMRSRYRFQTGKVSQLLCDTFPTKHSFVTTRGRAEMDYRRERQGVRLW